MRALRHAHVHGADASGGKCRRRLHAPHSKACQGVCCPLESKEIFQGRLPADTLWLRLSQVDQEHLGHLVSNLSALCD